MEVEQWQVIMGQLATPRQAASDATAYLVKSHSRPGDDGGADNTFFSLLVSDAVHTWSCSYSRSEITALCTQYNPTIEVSATWNQKFPL
jgi:hypothetical protein